MLGKGGMGEVYEAYDTGKDRVVALKLLSQELAQDPAYQVRFRRESQAAAKLAEPHVIPIHDWGVIDGVLFIDMRLVPGNDLRTVLRGGGPMSPDRAVAVVEQIAAALDAAHAERPGASRCEARQHPGDARRFRLPRRLRHRAHRG